MTDRNLTSIEETVGKWSAITADLPESTSSVPILVLLGEALDIAATVAVYWEPTGGKKPLPGLKSALDPEDFPETAASDLRELATAVSEVHGYYRAVNANTLEAPVERGEFLLAELRQCLEFVLDDGKHEQEAANLARLTESHTNTSSHDALALSLEGFAFFANRHRDLLANLPEFDLAMLDEAITVANRLREQSAIKLSGVQQDLQRTKLAERNRMITLLTTRLAKARRAIRFVFRNHPEVAQKASSAYQRDRRAAQRAADREGTAATASAVAPPAAAPPPPALAAGPGAAEGAMGSPFVA